MFGDGSGVKNHSAVICHGNDSYTSEAQKAKVRKAVAARGKQAAEGNEGVWFSRAEGSGDFGPIFTGFENQPERAIEKLMAEKTGEVPDAFIHPDLGKIAFVYGDKSMGLAHIVARRGMEWVNKIPEILRNGRLERDDENLPRAYIVQDADPANVAVIRLSWDGKEKTWLVSAYGDEQGKFARQDRLSNVHPASASPRIPDATGQIQVSTTEQQKPRLTTESAANLRSGDVVVDGKGNEYLALGARHDWLEVAPIVGGKPQVSSDSTFMFNLTESKADAYPERRSDPVYATGRNLYDQSEEAKVAEAAEGGLRFSRADESTSPDTFIPAPDGSLDYGEITTEQAQAMRRQAGKIRLTQGVQNADGTGHGLVHIEANHGKEIRSSGYDSIEAFVQDAVRHIDALWKPGKTAQLVAVQSGKTGKVVFVELQPARDDGGDYYRINSAFPAGENYVARKQKNEGLVRLWSRYPVSATASGAAGFVDQSPSAGETAPTVSPQSVSSIAVDEKKQKRPSLDSQSQPADRAKNPFTFSGIRAAIAQAFGGKWLSALEQAGMVKLISNEQAQKMLGEEARYSKAEDVPAAVLQAEFDATAKAYGGEAAYKKAKAEGKTKLNYRQWVQVRTARFKEWFGDWELPQRRVAPVRMTLAGWDGSQAQLRELATGWYAEHLQGKHFPNDDMGVEVLFSSEGKNASFATSGNLRAGWKAEMVLALPELLKRAVKVQENAPDDRRKHDTKGFHVLVVPLQVNGRVVSAKLTLRESLLDPNGRPHKFYDIAALEMENGPEVSGVAPGKAAGPVQPTPSEPSGFSVGQLASAIKGLDLSAGVSKVIDPETGEPLVVYHGTKADFSAFDNAKTGANDRGLWGRGHYFSTSVESANSYSLRQGDGAQVIPAFIAAKNPFVLKTGKDLIIRLPDGTNHRELLGPNLDGAKIKAMAQAGGHDSVIQIKPNGLIGDLVAFSPTQIKSATGNTGEFSKDNPDIRYSKSGGEISHGTFGPTTTAFKGDAAGAIAHLMKEKTGEALGALHHPEIGEIDLVWGEEGSGHSDGYGLAKIAKFHPEVLDDLQGVLSDMKIVRRSENRIMLESSRYKAGVRLTWDGAAKRWLVTAFEKRGVTGTTSDTAGSRGEGDTARLSNASEAIVDKKIEAFNRRPEARYSKSGRPLAFYDPETQTTYLIPENIEQDHDVKGLMHHEIGVHALKAGMEGAEWQALLRTVEGMKQSGSVAMKAAFDRAQRAGTVKDLLSEEALGYFAEANPKHSFTQRLIAWVKAQLRAMGRRIPEAQLQNRVDQTTLSLSG